MQSISRAEHRRSRRELAKRPQWGTLEEFARSRIQSWLQDVLEEEVTELLGRGKSERRAVVDAPVGYRNGHGKTRRLSMMAGTIEVKRPRVRGLEQRFESRLLPLFVRRTEAVSELLPQLYLHGLAQGDFELALRGLLGDGAPLSASSIERLRAKWQLEFEAWRSRRLDHLEVVYAWADGLYVKAGLQDSKAALLVIVGALRDGRKVVLAIESGQRESKESWARVLRDLFARGLRPWQATVADGHLGIWSALGEVFPDRAEQRCWNHRRTTNPVESPFSAVRLRTDAARRYKKVANAEALIWKILMIAEKKFRRLNAPELLAAVYDGQLFEDGMPVNETNPKRRAA